ncbi:exodeoxyribonuclease V subunit gamma [Shewanella sp. SM74]|uniref:exodeoxyribonuclease V subunit gamma n=1 Tax=Shewanella sp. SM74 TaxID=2912807 RepID=UPI0021DABD97|nr:exodeoxyribonuclease V subunit gamma [Shewanella sp. SM74]MCU8010950.1 exodeoxyribonuclease V subunit gamma [Shewanella sp. SM74]
MLKLIQSNQMEVLCAHLAAYLTQPLAFARLLSNEHILVQSPGMSTWLRLEIAKQNGIAAALEFPLPSSFTWQLCHDLLPNVPKDNAFTKAAMTWKLMQLLPRMLQNDAFGPLRHYLSHQQSSTNATDTSDMTADDIKLYQLCGRIADIFDQYLVYRPDWILAWEQNEHPESLTKPLNEDQRWQPILWRALIAFNHDELNQSHYHRANLHSDLIAALNHPDTSLAKLPQRLFVFGISSMAPQTLEVLYHLASRIDVIVLGLSPCQHYWGDIVDPRNRARMAVQYAGKRQLAELWEDKLEVGNPLLANNGKMGRELLDMLLELPAEHCDFGDDVYCEPCDDPNLPHSNASMLHGVQYDILEMQTLDRVLGPDAELYQNVENRRLLKRDDESIRVKSCHSPLREVETLHDHLLELLSNNVDLTPKDIVVMMPDVAAYAPYIDAVFSAKQGLYYIPYAIADRGAAQESPLINSFLNLLGINQSRFGLTDILSILEVPAILRRFQLDDDELQLIRRWLDEAGVRWGRDEQSRLKQGVPAFEQNSWAFGIKRLILGYALSDDAPLYQDHLVVTGIEGQSAQALGKLLNFIEVLDETAQILALPQVGALRLAELTKLLDAFYDTDEDEREQLQEIRDAIAALEQELLSAGRPLDTKTLETNPLEALTQERISGLSLSIEVLQQWFNQRLTESRVGQRYLAGSVNFCTLMPMRSIPFKVVCLLGMNDGVYPRVQHPVGFDLMAHFGARKGDRSRRLDDRYLFLEALLSAREQLYISYIGRSERDNSERIASMLVSELIEYCQLCYLPETLLAQSQNASSPIDPEDAEKALYNAIVSHQPLQPFDPKLYQATEKNDDKNGSNIDGSGRTPNSSGIGQSYSLQWCPPNTDAVGTHAGRFIGVQTRIMLDADEQDSVPDSEHEQQQSKQVDVSALIRFFRNPAQYFFNRTLKVDLSLNIQADDNDEPFSLNALERYMLQAKLLDDAIGQGLTEPDIELIKRLKASGTLPMQPFDDLLLRQYQHDIKPLIGRTLFLKGEQASSHADIKLVFDLPITAGKSQQVLLQGRIDDISPKGLVNYRPGSAHGRDVLRLYLRHLCLMAMGHTHASYLLDMGHFHALAPITAERAHALLADLLVLFYQGQQHPLCFMPRTSLAYVSCEGEHDERLQQALPEWLDEQSQLGEAAFGEGNEPHYQRLFSFPRDFSEDSFGALAERIYRPMVSLYIKDTLAQLEEFALNDGMSQGPANEHATDTQALAPHLNRNSAQGEQA